MPVVMLGVGADGTNVRPPPALGPDRRFEYVPIPEKVPTVASATTESRTFGSMPQRYGDGSLADLLDRIRPGGSGNWITDRATIDAHPVHHDPNLEALTYGEGGKDQNVAAIETLETDDILAFYTGLETGGYLHRYVFGYVTLARPPIIIDADTPENRVGAIMAAHPENAHAKRYAATGSLYAFDPDRPTGASRVAIVEGQQPGGLLDRAVRLSDPDHVGNYYMQTSVATELDPDGTYLGGFKPPIRCDVAPAAFVDFLDRRQ